MSGKADWQKANDEYLSAALAWLQLRLARLAPDESPEMERPELIKIPPTSPPPRGDPTRFAGRTSLPRCRSGKRSRCRVVSSRVTRPLSE